MTDAAIHDRGCRFGLRDLVLTGIAGDLGAEIIGRDYLLHRGQLKLRMGGDILVHAARLRHVVGRGPAGARALLMVEQQRKLCRL